MTAHDLDREYYGPRIMRLVDEEFAHARFGKIICPWCEGAGALPFGGGVVFTNQDREWLDDEDFMESYMQGRYDEPCPDCKGAKTLTPERFADRLVHAEHEAERAAELRAGC